MVSRNMNSLTECVLTAIAKFNIKMIQLRKVIETLTLYEIKHPFKYQIQHFQEIFRKKIKLVYFLQYSRHPFYNLI